MTTNPEVMVRKYSLHSLTPVRSESLFTSVVFLPGHGYNPTSDSLHY